MAPETAIDNQDQVAQFLAAYRAEDDRQQAAFERQMAPFLAAQQQGLRRRKTS
jgi:hypothetical protein